MICLFLSAAEPAIISSLDLLSHLGLGVREIVPAIAQAPCADVAQSVEQLFRKQQVVGSSPTVGFPILGTNC